MFIHSVGGFKKRIYRYTNQADISLSKLGMTKEHFYRIFINKFNGWLYKCSIHEL